MIKSILSKQDIKVACEAIYKYYLIDKKAYENFKKSFPKEMKEAEKIIKSQEEATNENI